MTAESCLSESDERRVCLVLVRNLRLNSELIWLPTLRTWSFVGRGEFLLGMKGTGWDLATLVKSELFEGVVSMCCGVAAREDCSDMSLNQ